MLPEGLKMKVSCVWVVKAILDRRGHTDTVPGQGIQGGDRWVGLTIYFIRNMSQDVQVQREGQARTYPCARVHVEIMLV